MLTARRGTDVFPDDSRHVQGKALGPTVSITDKPALSALLDHVRWLSALVVLIGHTRNALFLPYAAVQDPGPAIGLFYGLTNLQNEAVICFFVISGLLIGGKLLDYLRRPVFPIRRYVIDRLSRLYVVLVPALALSFCVAFLGGCDSPTVLEWAGAVLHLQHILTETPACNSPIWSLANEFWYYALGLAAALAWRGSRLALGAMVAVVATLMVADPWDGHNVLLYLPIWALGLAVPHLPRLRRPGLGRWLALALFAVAILASRSRRLDEVFWLRDVFIALGLVLVLAAAPHGPLEGAAARLAGWGHRLAGFSFTLYLTHWPLLQLYTRWVVTSGYETYPLDPQRVPPYALWAGVVVLCLGFAALMARLTEANTARVRAVVERTIGR